LAIKPASCELIDFGFGPYDLGETFDERRFRFHDINGVMAKSGKTWIPHEFPRMMCFGGCLKRRRSIMPH
jgi:hypothetical protein